MSERQRLPFFFSLFSLFLYLRGFTSEKHFIIKVKNGGVMIFIQNEPTFIQNHLTLSKMNDVLSKLNHLFSKIGKKLFGICKIVIHTE